MIFLAFEFNRVHRYEKAEIQKCSNESVYFLHESVSTYFVISFSFFSAFWNRENHRKKQKILNWTLPYLSDENKSNKSTRFHRYRWKFHKLYPRKTKLFANAFAIELVVPLWLWAVKNRFLPFDFIKTNENIEGTKKPPHRKRKKESSNNRKKRIWRNPFTLMASHKCDYHTHIYIYIRRKAKE